MNKKIESILNRIEKNNGKRITLRRDTLVKMAQEQLFTYMDSYSYNNYSIFKDCATWSVYSPKGQQIYKSLTTGTLEECKKWLIYNLNKVS